MNTVRIGDRYEVSVVERRGLGEFSQWQHLDTQRCRAEFVHVRLQGSGSATVMNLDRGTLHSVTLGEGSPRCDCEAGRRGRLCYHVRAALVALYDERERRKRTRRR